MKFTAVFALIAAASCAPVPVIVTEIATFTHTVTKGHVAPVETPAPIAFNAPAPAVTQAAFNAPVPASTRAAAAPSASVAPAAAAFSANTAESGDWIQQTLCRVNVVRANHGLKPLGLDPTLNNLSQAHSQHMDNIKSMTHADPNGTLGSRLSARGVNWDAVAENIAAGMTSATQAQQALENSPGHLANMLMANAVYFGAGRSNGYYTQNFRADSSVGSPSNVPVCH